MREPASLSGPKIALLGVILESNRLSPVATRADFESFYVLEGDQLLGAARQRNSVIAPEASAFVQMMDATGPWQPVPLLLAGCHPHGPIEGTAMGDFAARIIAGLESAGTVDGARPGGGDKTCGTDRRRACSTLLHRWTGAVSRCQRWHCMRR